jgi:hypothetical protein
MPSSSGHGGPSARGVLATVPAEASEAGYPGPTLTGRFGTRTGALIFRNQTPSRLSLIKINLF